MNIEQRYLRLISGETRGPLASVGRLGLAALAPGYALAVGARNVAFDRGWRRRTKLVRPTISVGNITLGGTGKTPIVAWLAEQMRDRGMRPAVLMRGYKARPGEKGDEQQVLREFLGASVFVEADPDRSRAADRTMARGAVDVFLLDDAFQHRRIVRDVDLVLIDATRPFGYDHVFPRGLLREPLSGLRRATALLITRTSLVDADAIARITSTLRGHTQAPIWSCDFVSDQFLSVNAPPIDALAGRRLVVACGIGNPAAFSESVRRQGGEVVDTLSFGDHHHYQRLDVDRICAQMAATGAQAVVTTAKDWVKLKHLWPSAGEALYVAQQRMHFTQGDDERLMSAVMGHMAPHGAIARQIPTH